RSRRLSQCSTLQGLHQPPPTRVHPPLYWAKHENRAATLSGLLASSRRPRVARSSQPWAERSNPVGIERKQPVASRTSVQWLPIREIGVFSIREIRVPILPS